jgi:hypothetical protein
MPFQFTPAQHTLVKKAHAVPCSRYSSLVDGLSNEGTWAHNRRRGVSWWRLAAIRVLTRGKQGSMNRYNVTIGMDAQGRKCISERLPTPRSNQNLHQRMVHRQSTTEQQHAYAPSGVQRYTSSTCMADADRGPTAGCRSRCSVLTIGCNVSRTVCTCCRL